MNRRRMTINKRTFLNQRFESVQSLRGIAALFVLAQHICFIGRGAFGVDLFFLISGFIMMYTTEKETEHFLLKRLIRIIPLYYFMTIISYIALLLFPQLFEQTTASPVYLIKSLMFIPFSMGGVTQPLLRVGWTVNYEMLFYLLFFAAMKISKRYRALICSGMLVLLVLIGQWVPEGTEPFSFWTDSILLEFAAGMALFYAFRFWSTREEYHTEDDLLPEASVMLLLVCAVLFACEWCSYDSSFLCSLPQAVRWGIPSTLILWLMLVAGIRVKMPKFLVRLGDMSFSIYLIHYYPMRLLNKLLNNTKQPDLRAILITCAAVLITLAVSWLCYRLIEKKLTVWLKEKLIGQ